MQVLKVIPSRLWHTLNREPSLAMLVWRHAQVIESVASHRRAGLEPPPDLLIECGAAFGYRPEKAIAILQKYDGDSE